MGSTAYRSIINAAPSLLAADVRVRLGRFREWPDLAARRIWHQYSEIAQCFRLHRPVRLKLSAHRFHIAAEPAVPHAYRRFGRARFRAALCYPRPELAGVFRTDV